VQATNDVLIECLSLVYQQKILSLTNFALQNRGH
jgi:hypothetical protein